MREKLIVTETAEDIQKYKQTWRNHLEGMERDRPPSITGIPLLTEKTTRLGKTKNTMERRHLVKEA
jgi:hypothetical protein